ncbi:MAG: 4'-phosphopantetheinyl transferase superfamily protein [Elusimicrobia bacterium]|nr:4'-phosphopantetheinyl transferase superfamily protein [Elusimicrobiota bacterium]
MSAPQDLREVVAGLCKCAPDSIQADFSLDVPALRGSLKKAVLIASIRRYLGTDCMAAATAKTFAELEAVVSGKAPPAPTPAAGPAEEPAASSCGIDMEPLSALPETADYAGHQFYKENFSSEEIAYCAKQSEPRQHFAARWCAKEALRKCEPAFLRTPGSRLELVQRGSGAVFFRAEGRELPHAVSLTHTEEAAAAMVLLPVRTSLVSWAALAAALVALLLAGASFLLR